MANERPPQRTAPPSMFPQERPPPARKGSRPARRRVFRYFADRTKRRRMLLIVVTLVALGLLAAAKGLIGYYVFATKSTRFEVALALIAVVAAAFALGERRVARALEARFTRNTQKHRDALAALVDEIAVISDRGQLEQRLVARFDELFGTAGTVLFVGGAGRPFGAVAGTNATVPTSIADDDPLVVKLGHAHVPVAPADIGSTLPAPLVWPLRVRGQLVGMLASGEHDYIESFDPAEIEAITALADAAAANLALLDPARRSGGENTSTTSRRSWHRSSAASANSRSAGNCCRNRDCSPSPDLAVRGIRGSRSESRKTCSTGSPGAFGGWSSSADRWRASGVGRGFGRRRSGNAGDFRSAGIGATLRQPSGAVGARHLRTSAWRLRAPRRGIARGMRETGGAGDESGAPGCCRRTRISVAGAPGTKDDEDADPQAVAQSEAVALFIERARLAVPDFTPDAQASLRSPTLPAIGRHSAGHRARGGACEGSGARCNPRPSG